MAALGLVYRGSHAAARGRDTRRRINDCARAPRAIDHACRDLECRNPSASHVRRRPRYARRAGALLVSMHVPGLLPAAATSAASATSSATMSRAEASRRKIERAHLQSQDGVGVLARGSRCLASSALLLAIGSLHPAIAAPPREPLPEARSGERLSDWLLLQPAAVPATGTRYPPALMWSHPAEVPAQTALKQELLSALSGPGLEALSPLVRGCKHCPRRAAWRSQARIRVGFKPIPTRTLAWALTRR